MLCSSLLAVPVAGQGLGLPGPGGCFEDIYEPNPFGDPTIFESSTHLDEVNICSSDDWYRVDLQPGQIATFEVEFSHRRGDIDMTLHREDFVKIDISESAADREFLEYISHEEQTLLLRIYGYSGAANDYRLDFRLSDFSEGCETNRDEPLERGGLVSGAVCIGSSSQHTFGNSSMEPLEITLSSNPAVGDLDLVVTDLDGSVLGRSATTGPWERIRIFPTQASNLLVEVVGFDSGFGAYELSGVSLDRSQLLVVEGVVGYTRVAHRVDGQKYYTEHTPEGLLVELVRVADGFPVGRTTTGPDGSFGFSLPNLRADDVFLRLIAGLETSAYRVRVSPSTTAPTYVNETSTLGDPSIVELGPDLRHLRLTFAHDDRFSGAMHIASTARIGLEEILKVRSQPDLDVHYVWERGVSHACGSCYSDGFILLSGGNADPDEFDDLVILHELAHLLVDHLSWDDSPGGNHDGSRTRPLVAFAEGISTGFATLFLDSPYYLDTSRYGVRAFEDIDRLPNLDGYGTSDSQLNGLLSEWLPAAVMWDLYDDQDDSEPFDELSFSRVEIYRVFVDQLTERRRWDLGVPGVDFADWVNAFRCTYPRSSPVLQTLIAGHQNYPFPNYGKEKCEWSTIQ